MKVKSKLSVFQKRRTTKCNPRTVAPASAVCAAFAAQPRRVPTGSKKTGRCANVRERCGNGKRRRRRASNLPTNNFQNQYNSKCSWMQAADLMPLSVWTVAIFCHRKNFQNRLFKTRFSVGLNRGIFSERREQATQARKCKWSVNFLKRASKNRGPVAYTVRGFFEGTPLKTQKSVGLNRGSYCWTKNVFPTELKGFRRRVTKTAFCVGLNRGMFWTAKIFPNFLKTGCQNCDFYPYQ